MRSDEILERVRPIIAETYNVAEGTIELDTSFIGDYGADHKGIISLMDKVEEEFDICLEDFEKKRADTVRAMIRIVSATIKKQKR